MPQVSRDKGSSPVKKGLKRFWGEKGSFLLHCEPRECWDPVFPGCCHSPSVESGSYKGFIKMFWNTGKGALIK